MDDHTVNDDAGGGDALQAGLAQFQRAALEAVRAARSLLDAAESVLAEPAAAQVIADTMSAVARSASQAFAGLAANGTWPPPRDPDRTTDERDRPDPREGRDDGFERITVE